MKKDLFSSLSKKNFDLKKFKELKRILSKQGIVIKRKPFSNINFRFDEFRSLYLTGLASSLIVVFSFIIPLSVDIDSQIASNNKSKINNSKTDFQKVLSGESIDDKDKVDEGLDLSNILEDVFKFDELPEDTVRLSASTIEQLFKDTNYSLSEVRKTKKVKPIRLSLLPNEMKSIENSGKRKSLFIKIILPLVLEENNRIIIDRKKLFSILNKNKNSKDEITWLNQKFKQYGVLNKDLATLKVRMDIIPVSLAIAQAAKETGWGTSRFAIEGNALFGQWTWSGEGIKPAGADTDATYKVMKFNVLKASVRAYQRNLNTHSSYKKFRFVRAQLRDDKKKLDSLKLAEYLDNYAQTGTEYTKVLKQIIQQNQLKDFDEVKLLPLSIKYKNII
ncbi:glucosaminidase domain-containing protein [Candidatus Pelagibacter sp.]|nr:glucosaminidase domain-containing protein [Candidatus Pelagibacter sp.]